MSDEADLTQDRLEKEETIRKQYLTTIKYVESTGYCLNCGVTLPPNRRWCDKDCADDWDYHQQRK
jgi:RNA polymerase-binding transcription factor DksA